MKRTTNGTQIEMSSDTCNNKRKKKTGERNPRQELKAISEKVGHVVTDRKFAQYMDSVDPLRFLRQEFCYPKMKTLSSIDAGLVDPDEDCVYFCGNSLGLMPKIIRKKIDRELDKWEKTGVYGHFEGAMPWASGDTVVEDAMARVVGGRKGEVCLMNGLTVNLHLLLLSFYRPTATRHKILCEDKAFPSDHYAFESEIRLKGFDPETSLVCIAPRPGERLIRLEDIVSKIEEEGDSIAVVCFSGVQYYTGQVFDMKAITEAGHKKGCIVGFDMAHAVGNIPLYLHEWDIDFACWCTYKYLCSGAGGIAGAFIHERHSSDYEPQLQGWWGHKFETRFNMENKMDLSPGVHGYRLSNPPVLLCAALESVLEVLGKTTMEDLREKSVLLTGYLELLLNIHYPKPSEGTTVKRPFVEIITPSDPDQRGCQLSLVFSCPVSKAFEELSKRGVVCDKRDPNVLRLAPTHMYNSFEDVWKFIDIFHDSIHAAHLDEDITSEVNESST